MSSCKATNAKTMLFAMGEIALSASAFAIFGAWSTEPWR